MKRWQISLSRTRFLTAVSLAAAALAAALALSACGGGTSATAADAGGSGKSSDEVIVASHDTVTDGESSTVIEAGRYPNGHDTDEENASGKKHIKPCTLVSVHQAEAILGPKVTRVEHLQGPTCIYTGSGREVSLALQEVSLRQLREGARKASPVTINGRTGWCLRYEKSSVAVAAGSHGVLVVGGPCQAGVRFAATALGAL
jgi:hypothetical protein